MAHSNVVAPNTGGPHPHAALDSALASRLRDLDVAAGSLHSSLSTSELRKLRGPGEAAASSGAGQKWTTIPPAELLNLVGGQHPKFHLDEHHDGFSDPSTGLQFMASGNLLKYDSLDETNNNIVKDGASIEDTGDSSSAGKGHSPSDGQLAQTSPSGENVSDSESTASKDQLAGSGKGKEKKKAGGFGFFKKKKGAK